MKKTIMVLLITIMVLGLMLTGCSKVKETIKEMSEGKENIMEDIKEISEAKEDIMEIINTEVTDEDKENIMEIINTEVTGEDKPSDSEGEDTQVVLDVWGEIAKYKVDNIIEEKSNSGVYILAYISKEETANLVDYFDELLKETEEYSCKKVTEKETIIDGYLRGTINGNSIIVAVEYDNVKDENRVEFTSYKK